LLGGWTVQDGLESDDQERIVAKRTPKRPHFPCRPHHSHAASGLEHAFNDRSAGMAKLMRKFAQA